MSENEKKPTRSEIIKPLLKWRILLYLGSVTAASAVCSFLATDAVQFITQDTKQPVPIGAPAVSAMCPESTPVVGFTEMPHLVEFQMDLHPPQSVLKVFGPFVKLSSGAKQMITAPRPNYNYGELDGKWTLPDLNSPNHTTYALTNGTRLFGVTSFDHYLELQEFCRDSSGPEPFWYQRDIQQNESTDVPTAEPTNITPFRQGEAIGDVHAKFSALNFGILGEQNSGDN